MKFSEQWLREWINPTLSTSELAGQLTMAGLEVDAIEPVAADFTGVVVGEITAIAQHPNADKLRVCQVNDGTDIKQVVCGAANARMGLKAPFATVSAVLAEDIIIKKTRLRGVESHGMLCAAEELGLAESSDGLMELNEDAPVGENLRDYLQLDDYSIELDLTPNRADCLSIRGIAREIGVLNRLDVRTLVADTVVPQTDQQHTVNIEATEDCPSYVGRVIREIDITRPTPLWMQEKLRRSGLRSIDPIVDVTNYVLLELGQPLHAFDSNQLKGGIIVRYARSGEALTLLNGQNIDLNEGTLVIADQHQPIALAGVMGGADTAVHSGTNTIFLESAFFKPTTIAQTARFHKLHTDASHRFERGVDYQLQTIAIERATHLLLSIVGGQPGPLVTVSQSDQLPSLMAVVLRRDSIKKRLGLIVDNVTVETYFKHLDFNVANIDQGWQLTIPPWRFDVTCEADLLEEVARIYGYDLICAKPMYGKLQMHPQPEARVSVADIRQQLMTRGFQEAITYSFVDPKWQQLLKIDKEAVPINNPLSAERSVMRTSLWPELLKTALYNINRQHSRIRLFESGLIFSASNHPLPNQQPVLSALATGCQLPESWANSKDEIDFYGFKGDLESILALTGRLSDMSFTQATHPALHPGQSAGIYYKGDIIGYLGALHPELQLKMGFSQRVYLFEITLSVITEKRLPQFVRLSKHPEIRRDLAILVNKACPAQVVLDTVRQAAGEYLTNDCIFDTYQGDGIDKAQKSLALGLTFQHPLRTLNDNEINDVMDSIVHVLERTLDATLRDGTHDGSD